MTLTVHHLGVSQSDRVVWLCEELGIDYVLKKYDRSPIMAPAEYKALHPLGSAPVIEDGDAKIAESGACVEYILQTYGKGQLTPERGHKDYPEYLYWFRKQIFLIRINLFFLFYQADNKFRLCEWHPANGACEADVIVFGGSGRK